MISKVIIKVEAPDIYLSAKLEKKVMNGCDMWTMASDNYMATTVKNLEEHLAKQGLWLLSKCVTPLASGIGPEMETSPKLTPLGIQHYQELIGILQWACELGHVDILMEVSALSSHLAMPRKGHLELVYHVFGYLKQNPKRTLGFDPRYPNIDGNRFKEYDWRDFLPRHC
jgi:hypothetical protein